MSTSAFRSMQSLSEASDALPAAELLYPETDGRPMGETDLHQEWMWRIKQILKYRYRGQQVYVASDLLLYYEENVPARYVVPDVFVVLNCDPSMRRVYKMWQDGGPPCCVIEVTSKATRREDEVFKPVTYRDIGVSEYILYDPTADYLKPPLQGHRLAADGGYDPIPVTVHGLECLSLNLRFQLDGQDLMVFDLQSGDRQWMPEEAEERLRKEQEKLRREEHIARLAAEARVRELEEELRRLRGQ